MSVAEAAHVLNTSWSGADVAFSSVSTDTRSLQAGDLFVALKGPNFDGHAFVEQARGAGAVAAIVSATVDSPLPQIEVEDTGRALMALAAEWRRRHPVPLVAVTGSNGKTTVKEMIAAILEQRGPVLLTRGNFNNEIGLPLTLFRLDDEHRYAVCELGASGPGEIDRLAQAAAPDVGMITNAGQAHLEGFGSVEGVARAKGEIYPRLGDGGVAVINADDTYCDYWRSMVPPGVRIITFGLAPGADVRPAAEGVSTSLESGCFQTRFPLLNDGRRVEVTLALAGQHNVINALAAAAAGIALNIDLADIASGLAAVAPVPGRLTPRSGIRGSQLVDDTYNANPTSINAAIDLLATLSGERWLVLGDMGELGGDAAQLHASVGEYAREAGLDRLFACGDLGRHAVEAFGERGVFVAQQDELIERLRSEVGADVTALVKGSRSSHMEHVVDALSEPSSGEGC